MTTREEYAKALDKVLTGTHSTLFLRSYNIINNKEVCINELLDRVVMPVMEAVNEAYHLGRSNGQSPEQSTNH